MSPALLEQKYKETSCQSQNPIITPYPLVEAPRGRIIVDDEAKKSNNELRQALQSFHERLTSLETLEPCPQTNTLFTQLVAYIVEEAHLDDAMERLLQQEHYARLCYESRIICAEAESSLEKVS